MPVTPDTDTASKTIAFRVTPRLERELEALAQREGKPVSATVRRLVSLGLDNERRNLDRGER
jgi:predicted DNA-binding protein